MIIEFVGVPASGKSTLRDQLVALLAEIGVETFEAKRASLLRRIFVKAGTVAGHWRVIRISVIAMIRDSRPLAMRIRSLQWLVTTLGHYSSSQLTTRPKSVVILDEGVLQRTVLMFFEPNLEVKSDLLNRYLGAIPYPSLVIRLVLEATEAAPRYLRRLESGVRRNERFSSPHRSMEDLIEDIDAFLSVVVDHAADVAMVPVLEVRSGGNDAIDTLRTKVLPQIVETLENVNDLT